MAGQNGKSTDTEHTCETYTWTYLIENRHSIISNADSPKNWKGQLRLYRKVSIYYFFLIHRIFHLQNELIPWFSSRIGQWRYTLHKTHDQRDDLKFQRVNIPLILVTFQPPWCMEYTSPMQFIHFSKHVSDTEHFKTETLIQKLLLDKSLHSRKELRPIFGLNRFYYNNKLLRKCCLIIVFW